MNRSNRNMKMQNKKRGQTKQDIPKVTQEPSATEHEIDRGDQRLQDEDDITATEGCYHLSQRRDDTDMADTPDHAVEPSHTIELDHTRKINFLKAANSVVYLERKKIEELETGKSYLIEQVERITTKYGDAIIAILQSPSCSCSHDCWCELDPQRFKVFLPKRFLTRLSDDHLEYMNEGGIYLKFNGGKYHDLEFY